MAAAEARELAARLLEGDRRALARAISYVENRDPRGREVLSAVYPRTGRAVIIGVTGAPGVGKSTLVSALARAYRDRGERVGIVAVDPTSPFSGGALLGDRIRLDTRRGDDDIFFRSIATRGYAGGVSRATWGVIHLLDAAGYGVILLETVGAGQSEVEVMRLAHTVLVVTVPGLGDEVQAFKAGILEIGDVFVVNKADRDDADRTVAELEMMLELAGDGRSLAFLHSHDRQHHGDSGESTHTGSGDPGESTHTGSGDPGGERWRPPVLKTVARDNTGIAEVVQAVADHGVYLTRGERWRERRRDLAERQLAEGVAERLVAALKEAAAGHLWEEAVTAIVERRRDPDAAVDDLLQGSDMPAAAEEGPAARPGLGET